MREPVKIVECPRDGWQGLPGQIPAETKASHLGKLIATGFKHIDAVSFVSPAAVPQTADSERVLYLIEIPSDVEIIGIVVNTRGAERAIATGRVQTLGFPYSVSAEFLKRNQHQSQEESIEVLTAVCDLARQAELSMVAYLSMAFGNPYGEPWNVDVVNRACERLVDAGVREISLADTVGVASPLQIAETVMNVFARRGGVEMGVHLHARRSDAAAKIRAAYEAGCRRFDAAIGGLGGCPFAQDALVGNIPTEILLAELKHLGATVPELQPLDELARESSRIKDVFGATIASMAHQG